MAIEKRTLSAVRKENQTFFTVWAPEKEQIQLHITDPFDRLFEMQKDEDGYWQTSVKDLPAGSKYFFRIDDKDLPDPASQYQPDGVHGPSAIVDHSFNWTDQHWKGLPFETYIIYELHVGTFTEEGSFEAIIPRLPELKNWGINAIELMPVAQFPGSRNWGYDGVFPFAVQNSYGGPEGLKKLVDACHQAGMAVILDVVYNHLGPEGNYLNSFAPYFSDRYHTLWGDAINFDWEWSDGVREYFASNTLYCLKRFHIDAIRYDAIHAIFDFSPVHFWEILHNKVKGLEESTGRRFYLIAESDLNDPRALDHPQKRGFGFDAQWLDDFHHSLYKVLHSDDCDRYNDFGTVHQLAKAIKDGFVHCGNEWAASRKRCYGASSAGIPGNRFVAFFSNHDQVGNRPDGARPSSYMDFERLKLAAAALMLSPYIPMLFMGEEYAATTPFYYFVSHSDPNLVEAVRKGRKEEFKNSGFNTEPPDAQSENSFRNSVLNWDERKNSSQNIMLLWHEALIMMRNEQAPLRNFEKKDIEANVIHEEALVLIRRSRDSEETLTCFFNFSGKEIAVQFPGPSSGTKLMDSTDSKWNLNKKDRSSYPVKLKGGQGIMLSPLSVVVYASTRGRDIE